MIRNGRSVAEEQALRAVLADSFDTQTRIDVLTLDGTTDGNVTDLFVDGQVNWHPHKQASRSLQLSLADESQALPIDTDSPADSALYFDRMLRVWVDVMVAGEWVETPVFTGPITYLRAKDGLTYVECQGKERLASGAAWAPMTFGKFESKTAVITRALSERAGETDFDIPDQAATLPEAISLDRRMTPWAFARSVSASMGLQLFYDGLGTCRQRPLPSTPVFTFTGDDHVLPGGPRIKHSADIHNAVYVYGPTPDVAAAAVAPAAHPLSPWRLGRNDTPLYMARFIDDPTIRSSAEAKVRADRELADGLIQGIDVQFEATPVGFALDPMDMCAVTTDDLSATFRFGSASLPLAPGAGGWMTVGYLCDVTTDRSARR